MPERKIAAIDLGTRTLRLDVASVTEGDRIEILYHNDFPSAGISRGKVVNPSRLGAMLRNAVQAAEKFLGFKLDSIAVSSQKCEVRCIDKTVSVELDPDTGISRDNLDFLNDLACNEAAKELGEGDSILSAVPQYYNAGDEICVPADDLIGMMVDKLEGCYKIVIGKSSYEKQIDAAFREAGINHIRPVFCGPEMGDAVLGKNDKMNGVAIVDFGAGATSVSIFHGGTLRHYGAIPFGGNSISADIRNLCDIEDRLAENIKLAYGGCMPERLASLGEKTLRIHDIDSGARKEITAKYLSEIVSARAREIIEAILYEIQLSGYADKLKNGIVLTGGCAGMLNLTHFIKQLSGYDARPVAPSYNVFKSDSKLFYSPSSATSAALLLCTAGNVVCTGGDDRTAYVPGLPGFDIPFEEKDSSGKTAVETEAKNDEPVKESQSFIGKLFSPRKDKTQNKGNGEPGKEAESGQEEPVKKPRTGRGRKGKGANDNESFPFGDLFGMMEDDFDAPKHNSENE